MSTAAPIVVILNAAAGTAKGHADIESELGALFRAAGLDAQFVVLKPGQDVTQVAREAAGHASIVVAGGGDGTVSGVAAGVLGSNGTLGILPLGTLNHFAKDLRIPLDLPGAVTVIAARAAIRVDVGQVNDRVFVNNSSIGLYPDIVEAREALQRDGRGKWPALAIATLRVLNRYRGVTVQIDVDGRQKTWRTPFVFVGNNEYAIDGVQLGGRQALNRGRLFVYLAPRARPRDLPMLFAMALAGRVRQSGAFEIVSGVETTIATPDRAIRVALDGEVVTMTTPLRYRICPGALAVTAPPP
jgi:diacylglycerol kinase family enzyme